MLPRLVPEISSLDAFCDTAAGAGIGDSRSWIVNVIIIVAIAVIVVLFCKMAAVLE